MGDVVADGHIVRTLLRIRWAGRGSTIGRVCPSANGHCSRAFWPTPVRAGCGDGLIMGIHAGRVVEADQPRCISAAIGTPGSGSHAEGSGAGPVQGLDFQITNGSTSLRVGEEGAIQRGYRVIEAPALVLQDYR